MFDCGQKLHLLATIPGHAGIVALGCPGGAKLRSCYTFGEPCSPKQPRAAVSTQSVVGYNHKNLLTMRAIFSLGLLLSIFVSAQKVVPKRSQPCWKGSESAWKIRWPSTSNEPR